MKSKTRLTILSIILVLTTFTISCASSLNQSRRLERKTLYLKEDGTGIWHQHYEYYKCRVIFTCSKKVKKEYPFTDVEQMKWFAAKGFVMKVISK